MKNLQDFTVQDYLNIARRRLRYLILPAILVSIGTAVFVWRMPSIYKSETTILVSDRLVPEDYIGSLVKQSVMDRIEFAKQQIRSRTFVERIAQEFQISGDTRGGDDPVVNAVINSTEITVLPPNVFKLAFYSSDPNTAQAVTRRLAERVMQTNNTFRQEKVNGADQFLDEQLRQAADDLAQAEQKLSDFNQKNFPGVPQQGANVETLAVLQAQLTSAENDLRAALDQRAAYERTLAEHKDLKVAATAPPSPPSTTSAPGPAAPARPAPSLLEQRLNQKREELTAMLTRYKPEHPDVVRLTREIQDLQTQIRNRVPEPAPVTVATTEVKPDNKALPEIDVSVDFYEAEVRSELAQLNKQIARMDAARKELSSKVATYARRMNMPPNVMQEFAALSQDHDSAKQRYTYLSTRKLNSDLAGKVDTDANNKTFTTIDPPNLPQNPVRPDRRTLTAVGCLAGLMLGIGLAFAREVLDPTLSDEDSVIEELKLPVLTSIPIVGDTKRNAIKLAKKRKKEAFSLRELASDQPSDTEPVPDFSIQASESHIREVILGRSAIANEQYHMMRAELSAQRRQRGLKSLIVTSSVPDEGKTFVACCLAGMLAKEQDRRVLLIDGDLRTGSAGHALKIDNGSRRIGLSNVLNGEAQAENCLIPCRDLNLWFLPAGRAIENPVDLLSSPRLQQVMGDLTVLFDWIIVDSPPVIPIADTTLLSPVCDAALIVVRADRTPSSLIKGTLNKIGRERVSGIVLNFVREIKANSYYGRYYRQITHAQK